MLLSTVFFIIALILFVLAAIPVNVGKVGLVPAGLAFCVLAVLINAHLVVN